MMLSLLLAVKKNSHFCFYIAKKKRFVRKIKEIDAVPETSPDIS
jgi:hypothetical protein